MQSMHTHYKNQKSEGIWVCKGLLIESIKLVSCDKQNEVLPYDRFHCGVSKVVDIILLT